MVTFQPHGRLGDFAVHSAGLAPHAVSRRAGSYGVKFAADPGDAPLVLAEPIEIIGVDDGELALGESYAAVGAPEAQPAVQEYRPSHETFKSIRDCKGQDDPDGAGLR